MKINEIEEYIKYQQNKENIPKNRWIGVIIHHSFSSDTQLDNWKAIKEYHIKKRGFRDVGYHFGIEYINGKLEYQIGRALDWNGAHCIGCNQTHLGICLVGCYDEKEPSQEQYQAIIDLIKLLKKYFDIKEIFGHREMIEKFRNEPLKSCPGWKFDFSKLKSIFK
jgi:N-acetylmuramoyl-L-alanine amidase